MLSVTARIHQITQPYGGYLPVSTLRVYTYEDGKDVEEINAGAEFGGLQGLTVDYLTRLLSGHTPEKAFEISLIGASIVGQEDRAADLLRGITGLDHNSILNAYQLVGYDVAYRRGPDYFQDTKYLIPQKRTLDNISIMVQRGLSFLERKGQLLGVGFQFTGGYSKIISSGDGDYLTKDGLWDFKTSINEPTSKDSLQILIYYLMGLRTGNTAFQGLTRIGLFNPLLNKSYEINLSEISDETYHAVSRNVIGYKIPDDVHLWREVTGDDRLAVSEAYFLLEKTFRVTDFDPEEYDDGIHVISVDDYWTFYRAIADNPYNRPKFNFTEHVLFLKHDGYMMFISVSPKGSLCLLHGGSLRKLDRPFWYYYEKLPAYGKNVTSMFSRYWDAIFQIARYVGKVNGKGIARVHGCIVDIDFYNHIYLNPNGSMTFYYSPILGERINYPDFRALLAGHAQNLLPAVDEDRLPVPFAANENTLIDLKKLPVIEYGTDMYAISNQFKPFQLVHDQKLVAVWKEQLFPIQREKLPYCQFLTDQEVAANIKNYIEKNNKSKNKNSITWTWKLKERIKQMELIAVVKALLKTHEEETRQFATLVLCFVHKDRFGDTMEEEQVVSSLVDADLLLPVVLKPRQFYLVKTVVRLRITDMEAIWSIEFSGGKDNLLSFSGYHTFEDGFLRTDPSRC